MSMGEQVARAICRSMNINPDGYNSAHKFHAAQDVRDGSALVTLRNWQAAEHVARAAIIAMRDPTEKMARAAYEASGCPADWTGFDAMMSAAIDAALGE